MVPAADMGLKEEGGAPEEEGAPKKRPRLDRHVDKWVLSEFNNPARPDTYRLSHWCKEKEKEEVYPFARFNRKTEVFSFTDQEWRTVIQPEDSLKHTDWTKIETEFLFDLCDRFQLRFIVIAD